MMVAKTNENIAQSIQALLHDGLSYRQIVKQLKVSQTTICRVAKRFEIERDKPKILLEILGALGGKARAITITEHYVGSNAAKIIVNQEYRRIVQQLMRYEAQGLVKRAKNAGYRFWVLPGYNPSRPVPPQRAQSISPTSPLIAEQKDWASRVMSQRQALRAANAWQQRA